jgi:hypothetical protein
MASRWFRGLKVDLKSLAAGAAMVLSLWLAADAARATDIIKSYDFSGTLKKVVDGGTSVTGEFTLDQTNGTLITYSFDSPLGMLDPGDSSAGIVIYSPAESPAADFVLIEADTPGDGDKLVILFQTDLSSFSGSSFYTGTVSIRGGALTSNVFCSGPPFSFACGGTSGSEFTSGEATPVVPEPATWALMMAGMFGLGGVMRARRSPQAEGGV